MPVSTTRPLIGQVFVELGLIDRAKLALGLTARREGEFLGEALIRLGFIDRPQLRRALFEQYRRWFAGAVGLTLLALQGGPAAAAGSASATLNIRLTIQARASVRLVDTPSDLALSGSGSLARFAADGSPGTSYSILVESESARRHGTPVLVAGDGASLPYSVVRGEETLHFSEGRALLAASSGARRAAAPTDLKFALPPGAPAAQTLYADTLRFVVRAH